MKSLYPAKLPTSQRQLYGQKRRATPGCPQPAARLDRTATPGCWDPTGAREGRQGAPGGAAAAGASAESMASKGRHKPLIHRHANQEEPAVLRGREAATMHREEPWPFEGLRCKENIGPRLALAQLGALTGSGRDHVMGGDANFFYFGISLATSAEARPRRPWLAMPLCHSLVTGWVRHQAVFSGSGSSAGADAQHASGVGLPEPCQDPVARSHSGARYKCHLIWSNAKALPERGPGKFNSHSNRFCCSSNTCLTSVLKQ